MVTVLAVSDATAHTAERVLQSALVQFEGADVEIERRGHVLTATAVASVVREASLRRCLIVHTLVSDELRRVMASEARLKGVDALDLMGPVLERLATHVHLSPSQKPGLFGQIEEVRNRAIEAVDFAFRHDDGQRVDEIGRAEIVLVGVSRSMKTPTTLYLAYRGWYAANVPLVESLEPPEVLLDVPASRVFCLVMSAQRLVDLRRVRAEHLGMGRSTYATAEQVRHELAHAAALCRLHGWTRLDVTGKSVEEVAREIVMLLPDKDSPGRWHGA